MIAFWFMRPAAVCVLPAWCCSSQARIQGAWGHHHPFSPFFCFFLHAKFSGDSLTNISCGSCIDLFGITILPGFSLYNSNCVSPVFYTLTSGILICYIHVIVGPPKRGVMCHLSLLRNSICHMSNSCVLCHKIILTMRVPRNFRNLIVHVAQWLEFMPEHYMYYNPAIHCIIN